jgi:hypothetical protein
MARWGVAFISGGSNVKGIGYLTAAAASPRRAKILDYSFGSSQSPADNEFIHVIQRCSSASTGTAKTPNADDAGDTLASTIVAADTITADSGGLTAGAFNMNLALNQRASFRWVPVQGDEIIIPATASNGFMFGVSAATTTTFASFAHFEEL